MNRAVVVARFVWHFVVGDDPQIALWVTVALLGTLALTRGGVAAWWLLPLVVSAVLVLSLVRASVDERRRGPGR
jgi:hypothetical protein